MVTDKNQQGLKVGDTVCVRATVKSIIPENNDDCKCNVTLETIQPEGVESSCGTCFCCCSDVTEKCDS